MGHDWTPIGEVEWEDGGLYWVRKADGYTHIYTYWAGAAEAGCSKGAELSGVHVHGPLNPPAWQPEALADKDQP